MEEEKQEEGEEKEKEKGVFSNYLSLVAVMGSRMWYRTVVLKLEQMSESFGGLVKHRCWALSRVSDSIDSDSIESLIQYAYQSHF